MLFCHGSLSYYMMLQNSMQFGSSLKLNPSSEPGELSCELEEDLANITVILPYCQIPSAE